LSEIFQKSGVLLIFGIFFHWCSISSLFILSSFFLLIAVVVLFNQTFQNKQKSKKSENPETFRKSVNKQKKQPAKQVPVYSRKSI